MDRKEKITGYTGIHSSFNLCNILLTAIKIFISQFDNIKRYSKPITGFTHFAPEEKTNVLDFVLGFCFSFYQKIHFQQECPQTFQNAFRRILANSSFSNVSRCASCLYIFHLY